jgi:phenylalanyl-tRNA synthetase alpha subunit
MSMPVKKTTKATKAKKTAKVAKARKTVKATKAKKTTKAVKAKKVVKAKKATKKAVAKKSAKATKAKKSSKVVARPKAKKTTKVAKASRAKKTGATVKSTAPPRATKELSRHSLDTETRNNLPDSKFAFPEERKEPIEDAAHVRNAIARFDQVSDVSDEERDQARERIEDAAAAFGVQVNEGDWRDGAKEDSSSTNDPQH